MKVKVVVILLLIVFDSLSALQTQELKSEQTWGQYSQLIEANQEYTNFAAQHYLCGVEFLRLKLGGIFLKCGCGHPWHRYLKRQRCNQCANTFKNKAYGMTATFCNYRDWNDQIIKTFSTGSWMSESNGKVMCPINTYASGFQGKFGFKKDQRLGLHGMLLRCTSSDYKNSQHVQDSQGRHSSFYAAKYGLFLSSFKLKFVPEGILTGIHMFAEGMPLISKIKINYYPPSDMEGQPVIIDIFSDQNCGSSHAQRKISWTNCFQATGQWSSPHSKTKGYLISPMRLNPPSLNTSDSISTGLFKFDVPVTTYISSYRESIVDLKPFHLSTVSRIIKVLKASIPYTVILTLTNNVTNDFIMEYVIQGHYVGDVATSPIQTKFEDVEEKNCPDYNSKIYQSNNNQRNLRI